jgi:hypothetical protein
MAVTQRCRGKARVGECIMKKEEKIADELMRDAQAFAKKYFKATNRLEINDDTGVKFNVWRLIFPETDMQTLSVVFAVILSSEEMKKNPTAKQNFDSSRKALVESKFYEQSTPVQKLVLEKCLLSMAE